MMSNTIATYHYIENKPVYLNNLIIQCSQQQQQQQQQQEDDMIIDLMFL